MVRGSMTPMRNYKPGPGRPSLGARQAFLTRLPKDVADLATLEAEARDLSRSEYLAILIAQAHGIPTPLPPRRQGVPQQGTLDTLSA